MTANANADANATTGVIEGQNPSASANATEGQVSDIHQHKDAKGQIVNAPGTSQDCDQCNPRDEYGRDAAERTVELSSQDAELVNREVEQGKHKSYDDGLSFVLSRGFAEIARTREAARKLFEMKVLKAKQQNWSKLLQSNPALLGNADLMNSMLKELGIIAQATPSVNADKK